MAKRRKRRARIDWKRTILLVVCFPWGLIQMWRPSCRWPKPVKTAVTALAAALVAAIVLSFALPGRSSAGGVEIVRSAPSVEIFGPELPQDVGEDADVYAGAVYTRVTSVPVPTPEPEVTVYVAANGKYYHTATCRFYQTASRSMTLYEAYFSDYDPCPECNPGVYEMPK